jgi:hypothetical protein
LDIHVYLFLSHPLLKLKKSSRGAINSWELEFPRQSQCFECLNTPGTSLFQFDAPGSIHNEKHEHHLWIFVCLIVVLQTVYHPNIRCKLKMVIRSMLYFEHLTRLQYDNYHDIPQVVIRLFTTFWHSVGTDSGLHPSPL